MTTANVVLFGTVHTKHWHKGFKVGRFQFKLDIYRHKYDRPRDVRWSIQPVVVIDSNW